MTASKGAGRRLWYLDALRIVAAFWVVANHTITDVILSSAVGGATWWLSTAWYYVSKLAVPLFIMISGACLLQKVDSYKKVLWRVVRVALAMLLFAYAYFLYDAWVYYGLWPRAVQLGEFVSLVWQCGILDDFWYVFMYAGLLLMLPCLQRMARGMRGKDMLYLAGMTLLLDAAWGLAAHYVPALALPKYFDAPLFSAYIGCFFFGAWARKYFEPTRRAAWICAALLAAMVVVSALLTYLEAGRGAEGRAVLFMDERTQPSVFMLCGAGCAMIIAKRAFAGRRLSERRERALCELGGCAFAIYLLQGFLIMQTKKRLFEPLCAAMPPLAAALVWELIVFAAALAVAWVIRLIKPLRKIV